jgi:hypothetical protein
MNDFAEWLHDLGRFGFLLAVWVSMIVGLFDVVRRMAAFGATKRLALYLLGYTLLSAVVGGFYFWAYRTEANILAKLPLHFAELPDDWAKDQPLAARHKGSKARATLAFRAEGLLVNHLDENGKWIQYRPTAEDIAQRDAHVKVTTRLADQSQTLLTNALQWWLGCVFAAVLGFVFGLGAQEAANSTVERDARNSGARPSP